MPIYFDPALALERQPGFAGGVACAFALVEDEVAVHAELALSPNTRAGLIAFGFARRLAALADADVLFPSALEGAIALLYAAEAETWNGTLGDALELDAFAPADDGRERRIRFDRREYQRALIRLGDLFHAARRAGHGVRLAL